jgi:hypothetical protein
MAKRAWLMNEGGFIDPGHDAGSYVNARVAKPSIASHSHWVEFTADVVLADCSRSIRWTFSASEDSRAKLRMVIDRLQRFERALEEGGRRYAVISAKAEARRKRDETKRKKDRQPSKPEPVLYEASP